MVLGIRTRCLWLVGWVKISNIWKAPTFSVLIFSNWQHVFFLIRRIFHSIVLFEMVYCLTMRTSWCVAYSPVKKSFLLAFSHKLYSISAHIIVSQICFFGQGEDCQKFLSTNKVWAIFITGHIFLSQWLTGMPLFESFWWNKT